MARAIEEKIGPPGWSAVTTQAEIDKPPLALEFVALAALLAKTVKKLPIEAQPPAIAGALALIRGETWAVEAIVEAWPELPPSDDPAVVAARAAQWKIELENDFSEALAKRAAEFVRSIDSIFSPLTGPLPIVPHSTAKALIEEQSKLLSEQFLQDLK
jgi:hypothetical protein